MRVLHLHSGNLYGGVETLLATLARFRHCAPELEQHFALCFAGRLSDEIEAAGASVHWLGETRTSRPWTLLRARRRLAQIIEQQRIDAVISHMVWPQALFGATAKQSKKKLVCWFHNDVNGKHWLERWARRVRPDAVIANSRFTARTLPLLYPDMAAQIVHYPVADAAVKLDAKERLALREACHTPAYAKVIVQVSRLEEWKGQRLHLQALGRLRDAPEWRAWFVGGAQRPREERYLRELQGLAQQLGIAERVRFLGQRDDVPRLLAAADIFCQPNTGPEPFGIVFVEALYAGLPVVATAMGGALEIVDETCGVLVEPEAGELAEALRQMLGKELTNEQLAVSAKTRAGILCNPSAQMARLSEIFKLSQPCCPAN
jgi:glycosyltransferase involved in cell wall biosynthesis